AGAEDQAGRRRSGAATEQPADDGADTGVGESPGGPGERAFDEREARSERRDEPLGDRREDQDVLRDQEPQAPGVEDSLERRLPPRADLGGRLEAEDGPDHTRPRADREPEPEQVVDQPDEPGARSRRGLALVPLALGVDGEARGGE